MSMHEEELTPLSDVSSEFLRNDPNGWIVSRKRILRAALATYDEQQLELIFNEFIWLAGEVGAWFIFEKVGNRLDQIIDEKIKNGPSAE